MSLCPNVEPPLATVGANVTTPTLLSYRQQMEKSFLSISTPTVQITWKPQYAGSLAYFYYPTGPMLCGKVGYRGPHTYFSVTRLLPTPGKGCQLNEKLSSDSSVAALRNP